MTAPQPPQPQVQQIPAISSDDVVIAVMGVTGAGKTTFIQEITSEQLVIGGSLQSCTQEVNAHLCNLAGYSKKIWLLDTPGFDDTYKTDAEILAEVAKYLGDLYANQILLTGIIYLHRIQDPRAGNAAMRNIRTFKKLCGEDGLSRTVLVTTFWRNVEQEEGRKREGELLSRGTLWKFISDRGGKAFRYHQTKESAKEVVNYIITAKLGKAALTIQIDLIDRGMKLSDTEAGAEVKAEMAQLRLSYEKQIQTLKAELEEVANQRDEEVQEMRELLERETDKLKQRVEQIEHDTGLLEMNSEGLVKRARVAWRLLRRKT